MATPKDNVRSLDVRILHNKGVDNRTVFSSKEDFDRFEAYLYLLNAVESDRAANYFVGERASTLFESARGERLISIAAYSFLPTEFHIIARPEVPGGIAKFMQKLQTAYTMYFNIKYAHAGWVFHGPYSSVLITENDHLKSSFASVHLQAAQLFNSEWRALQNRLEQLRIVKDALEYRYSSVKEYSESKFVITAPTTFPLYLRRAKQDVSLLNWLIK
jgi:hypothetical protein